MTMQKLVHLSEINQSARLLLSYLGKNISRYFKMKCHSIPFCFKPKFLKCSQFGVLKTSTINEHFSGRNSPRILVLVLGALERPSPSSWCVARVISADFGDGCPPNLQKFGAHTNSTHFLKVGNGDTYYHAFQPRPNPPPHTQIMACRKWINVGSIPQNSGGSTPLPLPREKRTTRIPSMLKKSSSSDIWENMNLIPSLEQNPELHSFCVYAYVFIQSINYKHAGTLGISIYIYIECGMGPSPTRT